MCRRVTALAKKAMRIKLILIDHRGNLHLKIIYFFLTILAILCLNVVLFCLDTELYNQKPLTSPKSEFIKSKGDRRF